METKRVTAVDYLIQEIIPSSMLPIKYINEIISKAKEIEKIQIRASYCKGVNDFYLYEEGEEINWEQYYNETYGTPVDKKG